MAGLIGAVRTSRRGAAVGVWTLSEQLEYQRLGTWIGDADYDSVSLLLHMDGSNGSTTFTDSSKNALTVTTVGSAQISTAQSKFGGASGYFSATGNYISIADTAALELGSGNYTIEGWIKTASSTQYATIFSRQNGAFTNGSVIVLINNASSTSGDVAFWVQNASNSAPIMTTSGVNVRDDAWHHIAVVRNGTSHAIYVDGTSRATYTGSYTIADVSVAWSLGQDIQYTARTLSGYIDEFRVTKGVARYTANFTAPSNPFPNA
jgi:hypothetical protein